MVTLILLLIVFVVPSVVAQGPPQIPTYSVRRLPNAPYDAAGLAMAAESKNVYEGAIATFEINMNAVSYTHLTLPTKRIV